MNDESNDQNGPDLGALMLLGITGGVWRIPPVGEQPRVHLSAWEVFEVPGGDHHLIGWSLDTAEGRATSAIAAFDPRARTVCTRSGRVYELVGRSGIHGDARYVWTHWCERNGVSSCHGVSEQYAEALAQAEAPTRAPDEEGGR